MTRKKKKGAVRPRTTHDWQNKTQVHELAQSVEEFGLSQQFTTEIPVAQIYPDGKLKHNIILYRNQNFSQSANHSLN